MRSISQRRALVNTIAGPAGLRGYGCGLGAPAAEVDTIAGTLQGQTANLLSATSSSFAAARSALGTTLTRARTLINAGQPAGIEAANWSNLLNAYNSALGVYNSRTTAPSTPSTGKSGGSTPTTTSSRADPAVTQLQTLLRQDGYNPGTIDGVWGPNTSGALQRAVSAMGIAAATTRYGAANIQRLGTAMVGAGGVEPSGGGAPTEDQGGLFDGVTRWITGIFGGGTDQAEGAGGLVTAASGAAQDVAAAAASAAGQAAGNAAAAQVQQRISAVVSNPLFLVGAAALGVGVVLAVMPKSKRGKKKSK